MKAQRIIGSFLATLLLAALGLPVICGRCRAVAAEESCGKQHSVAGEAHGVRVSTRHARCERCGEQQGSAARARTTGIERPITFGDIYSAYNTCGAQILSTSPFTVLRSFKTQRLNDTEGSEQPTREAFRRAVSPIQEGIFGFRNTPLQKSAYHPLATSLKI